MGSPPLIQQDIFKGQLGFHVLAHLLHIYKPVLRMLISLHVNCITAQLYSTEKHKADLNLHFDEPHDSSTFFFIFQMNENQ